MKALLLLALAVPLRATGPTEIPDLDPPVGGGQTATSLAPALATPKVDLALPQTAVPSVPDPSAGLTPSAMATVAQPGASAAAPAQVQAGPAPQVGSQAFQATLQSFSGGSARVAALAGSGGGAAGSQGAAEVSAGLFDLSAQLGAAPVPATVTEGLPTNHVGKALARLRQAGALKTAGPGSIPGMSAAQWEGPASEGRSGETTKVSIAGRLWYLKRLGPSPDPVIAAIPPETRALNEAGLAAVLRQDPQLSRSFSVSPQVMVFRDGDKVYVLTEGLPAVGEVGSERRDLSPAQRADASIVQLVLGLGDMHGANVLPLKNGGFGLIDFEKLSRAPLEGQTKQQIDEQVMLKNFPLVDRLSVNDPALYRARFEAWRKDYEAGGRRRMDQALAEQGWSRASRQVYLAAVDRNIETYSARLQPYLDYANEWHERIQRNRAEAARQASQPKKKGLFGGLFGD